MPVNVHHGTKTRQQLLRGALTLAKAVAVTFGPHGKTCILDRLAGLLPTRDGVTVAREIVLDDPVENQGAQILKEACVRVNAAVGDGTSTTAILAAEILMLGVKCIAAGVPPQFLCRGMRDAASAVDSILEEMSTPVESVEEIEQIALLASNRDLDVAHALAEASLAIGRDGTIIVVDGHGTEIKLDVKDGMEIDRGPVHPSFANKEKTLDGPLVAVINAHLTSIPDIQSLLESASQWQPRELVLFALSVSQDALYTVSFNLRKDNIRCIPIQCPGYGHHKEDYLRDVAALAGATFVDSAAGMNRRDWNPEWFGAVRTAIVGEKTTVLTAYPDKIMGLQGYLTKLRHQADTTKSNYDRDRIRSRMASLTGGLALLKVGAHTENVLKERRARVEDALAAVKAALRGGVIPGAGISLLAASTKIKCPPYTHQGRKDGWETLKIALRKPFVQLAENAGEEGCIIVDRLLREWEHEKVSVGWDATQGTIRDLQDEPRILDPTNVTREALRAAVSAATTILSADTSITNRGGKG